MNNETDYSEVKGIDPASVQIEDNLNVIQEDATLSSFGVKNPAEIEVDNNEMSR